MRPRAKHLEFDLPEISFNNHIVDLIIELECLRRLQVTTSTDQAFLLQFRRIFRDLEAMASARIDGNMTGLTRFLEAKDEDPALKGRKVIEIDRLSHAIQLIDNHLEETMISSVFFIELHKIIREDITQESSRNAGKFRRKQARPSKPLNNSPEGHLIPTFLDKLIALINRNDASRFDSLKIAYIHHKFLWIYPFREANGLISRLLSYLMLLKDGYSGLHNRIICPSFSLGGDPDKYMHLLRKADSGSSAELKNWFEFVLSGLVDHFKHMDQLHNYEYITKEIIKPALDHPIFDRLLSDQDRLIMSIAMDKQIFQSADIRHYFPQKPASEISRMLKWLKEKELIIALEDNSRKYIINLENKFLIKPVISKLDKNGFLPFDK